MILPFRNIPWQDNEETKYRIRVRNEEGEMEEIGKVEFKLSGIKEENNKKIINIESITQLFKMNFKEESKLKINAETFKPLIYESLLTTLQGDIKIKGEYFRKNVKIFSSSPQGKANHRIPISEDTYDNSEIIHIFRALDFKRLDKKHFKILNMLAAQKVSASVELIGDEKVEVPAGEFECYRIKLKMYDFPQEMKQYFLYSKCNSKFFVKNIAGPQVIELISHFEY